MKHFMIGGIQVQWPVRGCDEHIVGAIISARGSPVRMVGIILVVIAGVHREGQTDLLLIAEALRLLGLGLGPRQRRQQHRGQNPNNCNHYEQLNQREGILRMAQAPGAGLTSHMDFRKWLD